MRITVDPAKNDRKIAERGLNFQLVADLDWDTAIAWDDTRYDDARRMRVLARRNARPHALVVIYRGDAVQFIGFRKAHQKEIERYDRARQ